MTQDPSQERWHAVYASDALSRRRKKTHLEKLKKLGFFALPRSARILDIACGEGEMLDLMAEQGFTDLTGIDPFAPSKLKDKPWRFVQGAAAELPFAAGDLDVILCAHSLHHFSGNDEIRGFLSEAARVLSPTGRLYVIDHYDSPQLSLAHAFLMSPFAKLGAWTSAFHDQLCNEREELESYMKRYRVIRRIVREAPFPVQKWRRDLFFFYFEGRKSP